MCREDKYADSCLEIPEIVAGPSGADTWNGDNDLKAVASKKRKVEPKRPIQIAEVR